MRDDATLAASLDLVYRHHPNRLRLMVGFLETGFLFCNTPVPARDHISATARVVMKPGAYTRMLFEGYIARRPRDRGSSEPLAWRKSGRLQLRHQGWLNHLVVKLDDFGPYDYHRDFDPTYLYRPRQWSQGP